MRKNSSGNHCWRQDRFQSRARGIRYSFVPRHLPVLWFLSSLLACILLLLLMLGQEDRVRKVSRDWPEKQAVCHQGSSQEGRKRAKARDPGEARRTGKVEGGVRIARQGEGTTGKHVSKAFRKHVNICKSGGRRGRIAFLDT